MSPLGRTLGRFGGGLDYEYHSYTRAHGGSTLTKEHPNIVSHNWETSTSSAFKTPEEQRPALFRTTQTDAWKRSQYSPRTKDSSGFVQNSTLFDGTGWVPEKTLHADNYIETAYRKSHNNDVPFHPSPLKPKIRALRPQSQIY